MPNSSPASLGEVSRRLDEVLARFEQIANDLPRTFVSKDVFNSAKETAFAQRETLQAVLDSQDHRIQQLEEDKTWLYRLVIGAVILAILGVVISATIASRNGSSGTPKSGSSTAVTTK